MTDPGLQVGVEHHCMVLVDNTNAMLIGGKGEEPQYLGRTYLYNFDTRSWSDGPQLMIPRGSHSCGMVKKSEESNEVKTMNTIKQC